MKLSENSTVSIGLLVLIGGGISFITAVAADVGELKRKEQISNVILLDIRDRIVSMEYLLKESLRKQKK